MWLLFVGMVCVAMIWCHLERVFFYYMFIVKIIGIVIRKSDKHQFFTWTCTNQTTSWLMPSLSTFELGQATGKFGLTRFTTAQTWGKSPPSPLIIYYVPLHEAHIQMAFCSETPKWESWNSQTWDSRNYGGP